jgi:hypothetical protein
MKNLKVKIIPKSNNQSLCDFYFFLEISPFSRTRWVHDTASTLVTFYDISKMEYERLTRIPSYFGRRSMSIRN